MNKKIDCSVFRAHDYPQLFNENKQTVSSAIKSKEIRPNKKNTNNPSRKKSKLKTKKENKKSTIGYNTKSHTREISGNYINKYKVKKQLSRKLLHCYYDSDMNKDEIALFNKMVQCSHVIDSNLCLQTMENYEYTKGIIRSFEEFIETVDVKNKREELNKYIQDLNLDNLKNIDIMLPLKIYLHSCSIIEKEQIEFMRLHGRIGDISNCLNKDVIKNDFLIKAIKKFLKWLDFDVDKIIDYIFSGYDEGKWYSLVYERVKGRTQRQISLEMKIAVSRVGQIENKYISDLLYKYLSCDYDLLSIIFITKNKHYITQEDINFMLGKDRGDLFWYILQRGKLTSNFYTYSKTENKVVLNI